MTIPQHPGDAATYAERVTQHVPALHDLHRMTGLLLAERVPASGRILVLGAGGGLELRALAERYPGWRFDGVDPSSVMLDQARETVGDLMDRVALHEGYIDDAPEGPFDGAVCLLTLHFLARDERLRTLCSLGRLLRSGAPLVVAHHSFPNDDAQSDLWLRRNADLLISRGVAPSQAEQGIETMKTRLPVLSPWEDEGVLREAGFGAVQLFFAAFTFKGWVGVRD
ncbi:class I SAM-dependent methyltransferase [Salinicola acroporae]|uniref:Methyltransferase n=1 Tax=Salinicola acroporae TaxID=1541440 RepID=A0ABT6IB17_9GAMM|nr:class I SAM-dependent methyltransferase [Salinicola acroporae]MDH4574365.1 methyltransferase [Salinicola acroporae]